MSKSVTKPATKNAAPKDVPQPQVQPSKGNTPKEKVYQISEGAANALLGQIAKLPWEIANPLIQTIQQTFIEVKEVPTTTEEG